MLNIRRADNIINFEAHWQYIDFESTARLGLLIETTGNTISVAWRSSLLVFKVKPAKIVSAVLYYQSDASQLEYSGRESLQVNHRHQLYDIAEMYAVRSHRSFSIHHRVLFVWCEPIHCNSNIVVQEGEAWVRIGPSRQALLTQSADK